MRGSHVAAGWVDSRRAREFPRDFTAFAFSPTDIARYGQSGSLETTRKHRRVRMSEDATVMGHELKGAYRSAVQPIAHDGHRLPRLKKAMLAPLPQRDQDHAQPACTV